MPEPAGATGRRRQADAAEARAGQPVDRIFGALADPQRRAIIELLRHAEQRPAQVAERLTLPRPALSRHLRVLREAGLVEQYSDLSDGRARPIRLRREAFNPLRDWVDSIEAGWNEQLASFKAHAEAIRRPRASR